MVTYDFGINAYYCKSVLSTRNFDGAPLLIKAGSKEQVALDSIAEVSYIYSFVLVCCLYTMLHHVIDGLLFRVAKCLPRRHFVLL